jgi:hypothetical protein
MDCYTGDVMAAQEAAEKGDQLAAGLLSVLENTSGDKHLAAVNTIRAEYGAGEPVAGDDH